MLGRTGANRSFLVVETQKGPSMRYLKSRDHLVTLIFAQLSHVDTLRGLEVAFNANTQNHYHLNVGKIARSTISDANKRRPVGVFADTFAMLARKADRTTRGQGAELVRLIDAS